MRSRRRPPRATEDRAYRRKLAAEEAPGWLIEAYGSMFASVRQGRFAVVSGDIPGLTRRRRQPFAEFLRGAF